MPKKNKTLCVDDLRHAEYYGKNELKEIADTLKATKELMLKVNSLRQQAGLSAIEN